MNIFITYLWAGQKEPLWADWKADLSAFLTAAPKVANLAALRVVQRAGSRADS